MRYLKNLEQYIRLVALTTYHRLNYRSVIDLEIIKELNGFVRICTGFTAPFYIILKIVSTHS